MKKLLVLLAAVAVNFHPGNALLCYFCRSEMKEGCRNETHGVKQATCGLDHPLYLPFCIQKTFYDKQQNKDVFVAGCENFRKPMGSSGRELVDAPESIIVLDRNVEQCQSNRFQEVKTCDVCKSDLCNVISAGYSLNMNFFVILFMPVTYFFTKFIFR